MYLKFFAGSEEIELKVVYGVENNSTFLECTPASPQARVKWIMQQKHSQSTKEVRILDIILMYSGTEMMTTYLSASVLPLCILLDLLHI